MKGQRQGDAKKRATDAARVARAKECFLKVLANTAVFSVVVVAASALAGLGLALALDKKIPGRTVYRAGIFAPYLTSTAAMALVWLWIFDMPSMTSAGPAAKPIRQPVME